MAKSHDELFSILRKDHQEVKAIFDKLEKAGSKPQRENLATQLYQEITPHMAGEEKAFYPSMNKNEEAWDHALEALEEHHVAKTVLEELLDTPADDETFKAKATVLKQLVLHHIQEEEKVVFDLYKKAVKEDEAQGVLEGFNREKNRKKLAVEKEMATA